MGKKRAKKKGSKPPPDPRTLPFLQEMFPNIEKDIVEIVLEQNEHDEEKTIQILTEMSSNDGSNRYEGILDNDSDLDEAVGNFGNIELGISARTPINQPNSNDYTINSKKHSPPKNNHFISTDDTYMPTSSSKNTNNNKRHSPQKLTPVSLTYGLPTSTSASTPSNSTPSSPPSLRSSSSSRSVSSSTGESGEFLSSMFPELDPTMVSLLYEENGSDVGKTVESLLSIVFMNHSSGNGEEDDEEAEALDEVESEALADVAESEGEEVGEYDEAQEDESEEEYGYDEAEAEYEDEGSSEENHLQFDGQFKFPVPPRPVVPEEPNEAVSVASQSEFIQNLKLLAELFPETPRTLLALELDEHDGNLQKTIESCCRADPEYLRKLSGDKAIPEPAAVEAPKEEKKYPTPVDQVHAPTWLKRGGSRPDIKYVSTPKLPPSKSRTYKSSKSKASKSKPAATSSMAIPKARPMDLAAKLKMKQLRDKFSFVDPDILEAVFVQSGHKVHATLVCLYDIYPHLRDASITHKRKAEPSSPEEPLTRSKREKPTTTSSTTTTTTTTSTSTTSTTTPEKPRKTKRKKAAATEEGEDEGEFITVSYRKKKGEGAADGSAPVTPKKVLDSEDIENTYQSYREKAVKAGEMRNLFFMQAAAAYQAGDGARAKQLSQRGRDYDETMKEAHKQACHQIFIDCNARFDTLASVDLHGLHVAESLQVLSQLLEIHDQMGETNKKPKRLRVITGVGKHSIRGIAKIKPAVKNFLRSKGYRFAETEAGVITISLS